MVVEMIILYEGFKDISRLSTCFITKLYNF